MTVSAFLSLDEDPGARDVVGVVSVSPSLSPLCSASCDVPAAGGGAVVRERARARSVAKLLEASAPRDVTS